MVNPVFSEEVTQGKARSLFVALTGSNIFALVVGSVYEYLSLRGIISTKFAWVVLVFVWTLGLVGIVISEWVWGKGIKQRALWGMFAAVILALILFGFDALVSHELSKQTNPPPLKNVEATNTEQLPVKIVTPPAPKEKHRLPQRALKQLPTPANPITQENSGGINVQQATTGTNSPIINSPITVGSVPKDISPNDMTKIVGFLSAAPTKPDMEVVADQFSGNAPFPEKFYDALNQAGWPMLNTGVEPVIGFSAPGKKFQGAILTVRGGTLRPGERYYPRSISDPINYLATLLEKLHVTVVVQCDPNLPEGKIIVQFQGGFSN